MIFGYARVSTSEQNIQNQVDLLQNFGCEKIYTDVASGIREDRKGLNEMLSFLRKGDIVVVYKTDRIFRSLKNMVELIDLFNQKGVMFKSISEPAFDTTSANGKFIIQIFGAVAEFERISSPREPKLDWREQDEEISTWADPKALPKRLWKNTNSLYIFMRIKIFRLTRRVNKLGLVKPLFIEWRKYYKIFLKLDGVK